MSLKSLALFVMTLSLTAAPLRFEVKLDATAAPKGASGRLLILMKQGKPGGDVIQTGFVPGETWMAAREVEYLAADGSVSINPDELAFPRPFSTAAAGEWSFMAVLDQDHSYAREGLGPGDLLGPVITRDAINPADTPPVALVLNKVSPPVSPPADNEQVKLIIFQSRLLSRFFGRPVTMEAGVVLPPPTENPKGFPAVYHIHGFGGSHLSAWQEGPRLVEQMKDGKRFKAVHVFLNGSAPTGHHVFADSANNGPWGAALTEELIPHLEKEYGLEAAPHARFLTGHSSGGWSALWLQVAYPRFFGGTWPTAPDPVDFRSFTGIDATPGSTQNAYLTKDGKPLPLVRMKGKPDITFKEFSLQERVAGEYGGQIASFEWVFSPRGPDGRPMPLFNRISGELDRKVMEAWRKYDISHQIRSRWEELGPLLRGKIRLVIGETDTFYLDESAKLLCGYLAAKGLEDACESVPERDHFNLYRPYKSYPDGLSQRIDAEMASRYSAAHPPADQP